MKKIFLLLMCMSLFYFIHAQTSLFNDSTYTKISQKIDPDNSSKHIIILRSNFNPAYTLKKVYLDSACTKLLSKSFFNGDTLDGPFTIYQDSLLAFQGTYKQGKWDGERKAYLKGQLRNKSYYNNGVKIGTWEEYNGQGILARRITFDANGNISSDIKY